MAYEIIPLSDELYYIHWQRSPSLEEGLRYTDEIIQILNRASCKLYFIADLRKGHISHVETLRKMSDAAKHPNYGGATAFSKSPLSSIFVSVYLRFTQLKGKQNNDFFNSYKGALDYLEGLKPGVTQGIEWEKVLDR